MSRRPAVRTAVLALLGACIVFAIGTSYRFVWDIQETCSRHGQNYDPTTRSSGLLPISQRCNATYDLVPSFVNPTIIVFIGTAIIAAVIAALTPTRPTEPTETTSCQ